MVHTLAPSTIAAFALSVPVIVTALAPVLAKVISLVVTAPRSVTVCKVDVFQTTTEPVEVDTAVSVPADRV